MNRMEYIVETNYSHPYDGWLAEGRFPHEQSARKYIRLCVDYDCPARIVKRGKVVWSKCEVAA